MIGSKKGLPHDVSLYIHVPFCSKKCPYCHFFVQIDSQKNQELFIDALLKEWALRAPLLQGKRIVSLYFGGGTPSLLPPSSIDRILNEITKNAHLSEDCEITLEANPEHVTLPQMQALKEIGINRLSFGVQSFDDDLLKTLGRTHNSSQAEQAIQDAHQSGIENISIDLMFELPKQTLDSWKKSLLRVQHLPITHLSLYNLVFEPGTVFYKKQKQLSSSLPSEEDNLHMLQMAVHHLGAFGFKRYEISAFAKNELYSRHNTGYWLARPFLGLGPSAFSYWEGKRFRNIAHLNKYIGLVNEGKLPEDFEEKLDLEARQRELFAVELRLLEGVHLKDFQERHGSIPASVFSLLEELQAKGWIQHTEDNVSLTEEGLLFYDTVATELI